MRRRNYNRASASAVCRGSIATITDKGEEPVERKELKSGVRVRNERAEGKGVTKFVILPSNSNAAPKADEPNAPAKNGADIRKKDVYASNVRETKAQPLAM